MEVGTLRCLNKYLFREKKYNNILDYEVENEDCEPFVPKVLCCIYNS